MPLPKLDVPTYEMELLSTGETIEYRPFLVKEEKILFMALEGGDNTEMGSAMNQILTNCVTGDINIDELPLFELEHILLRIRSKSVSDQANVVYSCQEEHEGRSCENPVELNIDLKEVNLEESENHSNEIFLTENIGILMKYPKLDLMNMNIDIENQNTDDMFRIIEDCVDCVFDSENTYDMNDYSAKEKTEFFDSLTQEQFTSIRDFFDTIPKLRFRDDYTCSKCGYKGEFILEGLENFFV
jgi:hypothetical protein